MSYPRHTFAKARRRWRSSDKQNGCVPIAKLLKGHLVGHCFSKIGTHEMHGFARIDVIEADLVSFVVSLI